jgi:S-adenosylmethionine synthetase
LDKGLLIAGSVEHKFGGGSIVEPMRLIIGDRATFEYDNEKISVDRIVKDAAAQWIRDNLKSLDVDSDLKIEVELKPGSPELTGIYKRANKEIPYANDTSAAVGYAPLTPAEHLILSVERYLSSESFKVLFPSTGDDIKIMGYRKGKSLQLIIAMPLIERFIDDTQSYFEQKREIADHITGFVNSRKDMAFDEIEISLNALDDPDRGIDGIYSTVTGTSAEDADSGEVGRGNRVNGLIAFNRPIGVEAAAGKNPVSHIGKIYTILSHRIAYEIYNSVDGIAEIYVWLCSRIGDPVDSPKIASVQMALKPTFAIDAVIPRVREIMDIEFSNIRTFSRELATGLYRAA